MSEDSSVAAPSSSSSGNDSGPEVGDGCISSLTHELPFSLGNPKIKETRGVMHFFREDAVPSFSKLPVERKPHICVLGVPNRMTYADFCQVCGSFIQNMQDMRAVRINDMDGHYSVLIKFDGLDSADDFYKCFNGQIFSSLEVETCHVLFVIDVLYTGSIEHACSSVLNSSEQPTCPECLEVLDQDSGVTLTTVCNHTFHCSCIPRWIDPSCPVCRYCQQQPEKSICFICQTSENLRMCMICGFVGCGSCCKYKEGHAITHWKETQHSYSLEVETLRVWDYVGDNYVHPFLAFRRSHQVKISDDSFAAAPSSSSSANDSGPKVGDVCLSSMTCELLFSSGNPTTEVARGIMHLFRDDVVSSVSKLPTAREPQICVLGVPNHMTFGEFCQLCGSFIPRIQEMRAVRISDMDGRYSVLIKFDGQDSTDDFYKRFNGQQFPSLEGETCRVLFMIPVPYMDYVDIDDPEARSFSRITATSSSQMSHQVKMSKNSFAATSSSPNDSGPKVGDRCLSRITQEIPFSLGNPTIKETRGVIHLFNDDVVSSVSELPVERKPLICVLGVPNRMTYADFCQFCGSFIQHMQEMRVVRINDVDGCYSVLIKFDGQDSTDDFYKCFNGQNYPLEGETCHVLFMVCVPYMDSIEHPCASVLNSSEQPTCAVCFDHDSGGIFTTICNHSFHCSCISRWSDSSCPVCRYCQQHQDMLIFEDPSSPKIDDSSAICLSSTSRWMDFKYIKDLGEGGYGSVSKCKNLVDQKFYAVKTISLGQKLPKSNDLKLREVYILSLMNHQHIIRYFQAWIEKTEENAFLYIQMEYCPGSLSSLLKEKIIDSALAWRIFHQILEAVIYIHEMGVVHRDLKPDNIFLDDNNDVKIGDFGLAKRVLENSVFPDSPKAIGSQFYMAPDFEKGRPEVDTYSLGVIFFELWYHGSDLDMLVALDGFAEGIIPDDWRAEFPKHALFLERLLRSDRPPPVHIHQLLSDIFGNEGQSPKPAIETQQKDGNIILQQKIEAEIRAQEAEIRAQEAERKYQELLLKVGGQKDK